MFDSGRGHQRAKKVGRRLHLARGRVTAVGLSALVASFGLTTMAQASTGASAPHRGGTITQLEQSINPYIDPAIDILGNESYDEPEIEAVYGPGLVYLNPTTQAVQMGFAQSLTTKDGGAVWTLVLRPGLKFSDGTAFNAAAVQYNITRDANPATGSVLQAQAAQLTTKVVNSLTLRITCTPVDALFPEIMAQDFAMIASPTALASEGSGFGSHPVGPGPFEVQSFTFGISWSFVRNPQYARFAPGQPYLNGMEVLVAQTANQDIADLQSGQGQLWEPLNGADFGLARGIGLTVDAPGSPNIGTLTFNTSIPPFNNLIAREAVYYALDPSAVTATWLPGNTTATNLFSPKSPYYNKKYNFPAQNTAMAQTLFNQLAAAGTPLKFTVLWPAVGSTVGNVGQYVIGALSQFQNVTVSESAVTGTQYHQDEALNSFQMTATSLPSDIPGAFLDFGTGGSSNYGLWSDPTVDAALTVLKSTTNFTKDLKAWDTIQQQLNTQFPFLWCWRGNFGFAYNKATIGGLYLTEYGQVPVWGKMYLK
jgi:peptide/nickel transport system substrate-binding protein